MSIKFDSQVSGVLGCIKSIYLSFYCDKMHAVKYVIVDQLFNDQIALLQRRLHCQPYSHFLKRSGNVCGLVRMAHDCCFGCFREHFADVLFADRTQIVDGDGIDGLYEIDWYYNNVGLVFCWKPTFTKR